MDGGRRGTWRSGIKHDCSKVMQFVPEGSAYRNGFGEVVELEDYSSFFKQSGQINPFVGLGMQYTYAQPDIFVDGVSLKDQEEPYEDLIPKWQEGAIDLEEQGIISATASAGVRFGLDAVDIVLEGRYQYFFSDKLEGLYAPDDPGNKNNDTMVFINVGVVYVFSK
jgi:hypothetical protein